jgi:hypothetical protein
MGIIFFNGFYLFLFLVVFPVPSAVPVDTKNI